MRLIAKHGYAAVSMRQIAAEVGVQAGALYNYTSDKQALLFDLMRGHMVQLLAKYAEEDLGDDPAARLDAFTRFHIRYHLEQPDGVFVAYMELRNLSAENFATVVALRKQYETCLEDILKAGRAAGVFQVADTKVATMALIAMLTGITTWYRDGGRLDRRAIEEVYVEMARKAVSG